MTDASPEGAVSDGPARWERAADLFADWRAGDSRAMDDLVRLMTPVLWHVVRAYRLERALAEDVVQSTWLALVRSAESITDTRAIFSWLTITARREAWRVGKTHGRADAASDEHLEQLLPPQESTEALVTASDESSRLWAAVQTLAERCQRLLQVVAFDERPDYAKIAADLDMPIGSIGPTRKRCLAKLRTALTASGFPSPTQDRNTTQDDNTTQPHSTIQDPNAAQGHSTTQGHSTIQDHTTQEESSDERS